MRYYRVITGYGTDDFVSIDETELATAIRAQVTGRVAIIGGESITGSRIAHIKPDYNRLMGYNRDYRLTGEDYRHIGRTAQDDHRLFFEKVKVEVHHQLGAGFAPKQLT